MESLILTQQFRGRWVFTNFKTIQLGSNYLSLSNSLFNLTRLNLIECLVSSRLFSASNLEPKNIHLTFSTFHYRNLVTVGVRAALFTNWSYDLALYNSLKYLLYYYLLSVVTLLHCVPGALASSSSSQGPLCVEGPHDGLRAV